ncbi:isoform II [Clostridium pasteurianum]|uniref:Isoform II n=1 Tax=Clostridium pasteurianum BC1 TaxID=86416 RepID=R4K9P2_CLOPA|nr:isoform II [Clostridium pasteurianum]AGK96360.1 isoform II [Clostridium pasteurianum BC1]
MRIFEVLIIIALVASIINFVFIKYKKLRITLPILAVAACILSLIFEGYRLQMVPAYCLSIVLLVIGIINIYSGIYKVKKVFKIVGITFLMMSLIISIAFPMLFPVINLPKPDGEYSVGTRIMAFTDKSRKGIFTNADTPRELAVQVWYPANVVKDKKVQPYISDSKVSAYICKISGYPNILNQLELDKTNSFLNTGISNKEQKYPVIVFSHGYELFSGQNTVQMEELASHGYVVFSISHTYEASSSTFPQGKIVPFSAKQIKIFNDDANNVAKQFKGDKTSTEFEKYMIQNSKVAEKSVHIWSDDTSFVADEIEKLNNGEIKSIFKDKLDMSNLGLFGHSFGGATAGQASLTDSRFKAFINMDGTPFGDTVNNKVKQPFMILTEGNSKNYLASGYSKDQKNYLIISINGAKHIDFTDYTVTVPALKLLSILGTIDGSRQEKIMNDYVLSFFNKHLKGMKQPLIDEMISKYPEVSVQSR